MPMFLRPTGGAGIDPSAMGILGALARRNGMLGGTGLLAQATPNDLTAGQTPPGLFGAGAPGPSSFSNPYPQAGSPDLTALAGSAPNSGTRDAENQPTGILGVSAMPAPDPLKQAGNGILGAPPSLPTDNVPMPVPRPKGLLGAGMPSDDEDVPTPPVRPAGLGQTDQTATGSIPASAPTNNDGGFFGRLGTMAGSLYGSGGPGDPMIDLALAVGSPGNFATNYSQISASRGQRALGQAQLQIAQQKTQQAAQNQQGAASYIKSLNPNLPDNQVAAIAANPSAVSSIISANLGKDSTSYTPLTDPAERTAAGINPNDTGPYQKDSNGKVSAIGGGGVNVSLPGSEKASEAAYGQAEGKRFGAILDAGDAAHSTQGQLALMNDAFRNANGQISTGPFAKTILGGKQAILNATGIDLGGIPETEAVQKLGFGLATNLTKEISQRPAQQEFLKGLENVPGIFMSQPGSQVMMSVLNQQAQQKVDLGHLVSDPNNRKNWSKVEQQYYDTHPLISPFTGKPLSAGDISTLSQAAQQEGIDPATGRPAKASGSSPAASAPSQIKTKADFDALRSGDTFTGPDGKLRRKP